MTKKVFLVLAWGLVGVLAVSAVWLFDSAFIERDIVLSAVSGDPRLKAFADWPARYQEIGGNINYTVHMSYIEGFSEGLTGASGKVVVNFETGDVSARIEGLPPLKEGSTYELLLVDYQPGPGNSVALDSGPNSDDVISLGPLDTLGPVATLKETLEVARLSRFEVDMAMVRRVGIEGPEGLVIGGMADFFLKWNRKVSLQSGQADGGLTTSASPVSLTADQADDLRRLIREGARLFNNETFDGNGRTCSTCHPFDNNFTIDPEFIAALPEDDPLFMAEFNEDLAENFENEEMMRRFGLILENTNGFDELETNFTMRGVPHLLALSTSVDFFPEDPDNPGSPAETPVPRTGWSGDGSPVNPDTGLDGSLRAFAAGAVIQHFTKTLDREPGEDFRLPTDEELDALAAFQLSLGRQEDPELPLSLKDPVALQGQELFNNTDVSKCSTCHFNAGANNHPGISNQGNANFDTGIEDLEHPADSAGMTLPDDDGFGFPGDGTFNTPPLVEAADTAPFFHNNAISTLEGAVAFYNSDAFNNSPAGELVGGIDLEPEQVEAIAAFLRVINSLENIRQTTELLETVLYEDNASDQEQDWSASIERSLGRAAAETGDAIDVLTEGNLHPQAAAYLEEALRLIEKARYAEDRQDREKFAERALRRLDSAHEDIVEEE